MPLDQDFDSIFPPPTSGSDAYLSGSEVRRDLSSSSFDAASSLADIDKTVILYSSSVGKSYKMPNANTSGMVIGKGTGFIIDPDSQPILILNQGTAGTDPVLECMALPGARFALTARSISTAVGDWRAKGGSKGLFHGPVPVSLPNVRETGIDLGSVALFASMHGVTTSQGTLQENCLITRLSSTLYVATFVPQAGTSVVTYAISYNHPTDAWTWGSPVTSFSSANQWLHPRVCALSSTLFVIAAWEATNAKISARACTVSGTTITQGLTIVSGAWGVNPSNAAMMSYGTLIADSATTCFLAGAHNGTKLGIIHFSVSGTTLAQDGGAAFASGTSLSGPALGGYCPSANVLDVAIFSSAASQGMGRYTYAAANVTNTFERLFQGGQAGYFLKCTDATNKIYWTTNSGIWNSRHVLNAGNTDFSEAQTMGGLTLSGMADATTLNMGTGCMPLTETEWVAMTSTLGIYTYPTITLFNPANSYRARNINGKTASNSQLQSTYVQHAAMMFGPEAQGQNNYMVTANINLTNRRLALLFSNTGQTVATGRGFYMCMFNMPRNYDAA